MNFKKKVNGSWTDTTHYIHNTSTDTITTLPVVLYPNDTTATVGLKGQAVQSSVPSPTSPVMPQGTGERTGNLAPPLTEWVDGYIATNGFIAAPSNINIEKTSDYISIKGGVPYTFSRDNGFPRGSGGAWRAIGWYDINKAFISRNAYNTENILSAEAPQNAAYCRLSYRTYGETTNATFNEGSTPLPYEPYGIKIPISSASTTTPVYLGEVETMRSIGKIDLGTLNWSKGSSGNFTANTVISNCRIISNMQAGNAICTHLSEVSGNSVANTPYSFSSCLNAQARPFVNKTGFENLTAEEFKQAMSGVYMYYVLTTEETGIVNEPLMKIGDYADTLSGISIPVTAGGDTLSVGTTVQPSEVTVNYKGWHPVADVHERTNGAWT